jgi:hypothetical protein
LCYSDNKYNPRIWLYSNGEIIGQLVFYPDGTTLPDDYTDGVTYDLYYHLQEYENCVEILRNSEVVTLKWIDVGSENVLLGYNAPVG